MRLHQNQLAAHLRQPLAPVYVIAGDEPLLIQESLDAIRAAARKQGYSERQTMDVERGFEWSQLTQASASLSLFASRRLIELNLFSGSPGDEGGKVLKALAAKPAPDTVLLVICGRLDSRQRASGWYTALENAGASLYLWPIKTTELPQWVTERLRAAGLQASSDAVQLLAERTEGNLLAAQQDIEKLKLLFPAGKLELNDVRAAVSDSARFEAFDFVEKVLDGDAAGAVRSFQRLREDVELPGLMGAWAYALRQWAEAAGHFARTRDARGALEAVHIYGPRQAPYQRALARAGAARVHGWLARCASIDRKLKSTGGEPAAWEELLTCVLAASGVPTATPDPR
jgi:DNA polymerase-3 subunit delta